jgi:TolA-binding protein
MKDLLNIAAKKFLLNEKFNFDASASVQALSDIVSSIKVNNKRDNNRLKLAKEHIRGIKRQLRSLNERVESLEEELNLLKEEK